MPGLRVVRGVLWEGRSLWDRCGGRGDRGAVGEDFQETEGDVQDLLGAPPSSVSYLPDRPKTLLHQLSFRPFCLLFLSPFPLPLAILLKLSHEHHLTQFSYFLRF